MPTRYDRAPIKATKTPEGFVQDSPILSRVGVFEYRQPDGSVRKEYRPAEEVFHADHLASIAAKPITDEHHGRITAANARGKIIGSTLSPGRQDGENVVGDIIIHDSAATAVKRELSLGYTLDLEETPGEFNGVRYDAIQRNLRVNHLALVNKGRAGNARLNLDAADAVSVSTEDEEPMTLVKVRLDSGLEYDASPEVSIALAAAQALAKTEKTRADGLMAERDTLKTKVDGHDAALAQARADALKTAEGRVKLVADAKTVGAKFAEDAKDVEIKHAVIKHVRGDSTDLTGKSDAYVDVMFDMALADGLKAKANAASNRSTVTPPARQDNKDTVPATASDARAKMVADMKKTTTGA